MNTLYAEYIKGNRFQWMRVRYYFNPEADGFDKPKIASWSSSDWHRNRVVTAPDKQAYIAKIKAWAESFKSKIDAGFDGQLVTIGKTPAE